MLANTYSRPIAWMGVVGLSLTLDQAAVAQQDDDRVVENALEEVIVTGTRITRRDFTSSSPLVTISRDDLEFSGQPTLEEYLNQMPQLTPSSGRGLNNGSDGTTQLNLRALGPGRTLVMLNGRRIAASGTGSAIDVNNIPSVLVERVEIITGGASTVYGSDAIAGVVNFITRTDFEGLSLEGGYNVTSEGDADIWDANAVYGHEFANGGHLTVYAGHTERTELFAADREFTRVPYAEDWDNGTLFPAGSFSTPDGMLFFSPPEDRPDLELIWVRWKPDGTYQDFQFPDDLYNFQPINYLQTPLQRDMLGVYGDWPLSDRLEAYYELSWARNQADIQTAESPFQAGVTINTDNPLLTPQTRALLERPEFQVETEPGSGVYVPGIASFVLRRRLSELGARANAFDRTYQRYLAGVRGVIGDTWRLDAWVTYTDSDEEEHKRNDGSRSRFRQGLLVDPATGQCVDPSGGCVPIDPFGAGRISQEAADFLRVDNVFNTTQRRQSLASVVLSGAPWEIWSGPVDIAAGAEWRRDEAHFEADPILFTGDTIGYRGDAPVDGTESVFELFTEVVLSLFDDPDNGRKLDLEAGVRWSDYDLAGTVNTWKAGLNWQATEALGLRTMYQHAVRAPNNAELFTQQFNEFDFYLNSSKSDPCSASSDPVGNGNTDKCIAQGLSPGQIGVFEAQRFYQTTFIFGGNPELVPESSDTFTLGLVWNPEALPDLVVSVDYWDLQLEDTIGGIDPEQICFSPLNTSGLFCDALQRDATGNVFQVTSLVQNRGFTSTDGIDVQVRYDYDLPSALAAFNDFAQLSVNATLSHVFSLEDQENPVTETIDCAGYFGWPCSPLLGLASFPENRLITTVNYVSGSLTGHLTWRWIDGMDNAGPFDEPDAILAVPDVPAYNYFDLGASYAFGERLLVRFGINNLLDKDPPMMADAVLGPNTDPLMYDVFGRTYYLNLRFQATGN